MVVFILLCSDGVVDGDMVHIEFSSMFRSELSPFSVCESRLYISVSSRSCRAYPFLCHEEFSCVVHPSPLEFGHHVPTSAPSSA
jgi:hypothetical protein